MNENIGHNDWKMDAPRLAAKAKVNAFTVPDDYFESVGDKIQSAIFLDQLKEQTADSQFGIPENYFEDLTERIETQIRLSELAVSKNAFEVPENYFESLQSRINAKVSPEQTVRKTKIVPLWRKSLVKYASAACFLLMASFGLYFYQSDPAIPIAKTKVADMANEQLLYDIDESTIIEHLEAENTTSSNNASASDTEVENYILSNFSSTDLTHALNN